MIDPKLTLQTHTPLEIRATVQTHTILEETETPQGVQIAAIILIIIPVACIALLNLPDHKGIIDWAQRIFGVFAGFAFLSWFRHSIIDFVSPAVPNNKVRPRISAAPQQNSQSHHTTTAAPQNTASKTSSSPWWESQPWQAILVILLVVIGATILPELPKLLQNVSKIKVPGVEVELRDSKFVGEIGKGEKLKIERTRQKTSLSFLRAFEDRFSEKRNDSTIRTLIESYPEWPVSKFCQMQKSNTAFIALNRGLLSPAASCLRSRYEQGASSEDLRGFVRKLAWDYKELLVSISVADSKGRERSRERIRDLENKTRDWMRELSCTDQLRDVKPITLEEALILPNSAWTYLALSYLQYIGDDRLEAISTLERQRKNFSEDIGILVTLGLLWAQEPGGAPKNIGAFEKAHDLALKYNNAAKRVQCSPDPKCLDSNSIWQCNKEDKPDCLFDTDRWSLTLNYTKNSLAYGLLHSIEEKGKKNKVARAIRLAEDSARDAYQKLNIPSGDSPSPTLGTAGEDVANFWANADTFALALVASHSFEQNGSRDNIACAVSILKEGRKWVSKQLEHVAPDCPPSSDKNNVCYKIRNEYINLTDAYEDFTYHETLATELFGWDTDLPSLDDCIQKLLLHEKTSWGKDLFADIAD